MVGTQVKAKRQITESGLLPGDVNATFPDPSYIHAEVGESGTVVHADTSGHTVRWDRTGTATLCFPIEYE